VTYTLNDQYGNKVTPTGLGFLLNNEMGDFASQPGVADPSGRILGEADAIAPRKTPLSSMTPTIVLRDGKPFLSLGTPGSQTIINTVLEVMVNVIDWKMDVQDAVNWPRFHHAWMPDVLQMEPGYSPDTIALLTKWGYTVRPVRAQGECAAILFSDGWLEGAADPRSGGTAGGY
jgi:gamma-glutamyltranspeptidase/glutathione hydrolase